MSDGENVDVFGFGQEMNDVIESVDYRKPNVGIDRCEVASRK
jgi:hypothetical protein